MLLRDRGCGKGYAGYAVAYPENLVGMQNTFLHTLVSWHCLQSRQSMPINLAILQSRQSISPPLSISPYATTNGALRSLKRTITLTVGEFLLVRGAPMLYGRGRLCSSEWRRYRSEGRYRRPSATGRVRDVWFLVQGRHYRREGRYFSSEGLLLP